MNAGRHLPRCKASQVIGVQNVAQHGNRSASGYPAVVDVTQPLAEIKKIRLQSNR